MGGGPRRVSRGWGVKPEQSCVVDVQTRTIGVAGHFPRKPRETLKHSRHPPCSCWIQAGPVRHYCAPFAQYSSRPGCMHACTSQTMAACMHARGLLFRSGCLPLVSWCAPGAGREGTFPGPSIHEAPGQDRTAAVQAAFCRLPGSLHGDPRTAEVRFGVVVQGGWHMLWRGGALTSADVARASLATRAICCGEVWRGDAC
jgi:hypothetical protein